MPAGPSWHHQPKGKPLEAPLQARLQEIVRTRIRYGFRCMHILIGRDGWVVNHKRLDRLYREEGKPTVQATKNSQGGC